MEVWAQSRDSPAWSSGQAATAAEHLRMDLIEVYLQTHVLPAWQQSWDTNQPAGSCQHCQSQRRWAHCWGFKWIKAASLQFHITVQPAWRNKSIPAMLTGSNQDKGKISPCVQLGVLSASQTAGFLALFPLHCIIYLTIKIFKDLTLGIYLY